MTDGEVLLTVLGLLAFLLVLGVFGRSREHAETRRHTRTGR